MGRKPNVKCCICKKPLYRRKFEIKKVKRFCCRGCKSKMYKEFKKPPKILDKLHKILLNADAYVIVSAEYNHSIPPALTNLLDHFYAEYSRKPSGIVCYSVGPFGGVRASMQLRMFLAALGMSSITTTFPISNIGKSLDANGKDLTVDYERRVTSFIEELEWHAHALKNHRNKTGYKYKKG